MIKHFIQLVAVISSLTLAATALAAVPKILHQAQGDEAGRIEVYVTQSGNDHAMVKECERCPLKLQVDASTRFFYRNKPVAPADLGGISGGAGTVIHDKGVVIRIHWDTDAAGNK